MKWCGLPFEIHPSFTLREKTALEVGNVRSLTYTPDFIICNKDGSWRHVIDVKNDFSEYAIDSGAKIRFNLFAAKYKIPVEVVVVRAKNFKVITQCVTKPRNKKEPFITNNFNYHWKDATKYK